MAITAGGQTIINFGNLVMGGVSPFGSNLVQPGQSTGACGNDGTWFSPECEEEGGPGSSQGSSPWGGWGGWGSQGGFGGLPGGCHEGQGFAGAFPGGWDRRSPWGGQQPPWEQHQWGPQGAEDQHCGWGTGQNGLNPRNPFARRYEQWQQRHDGMQNGCQPPQQDGCQPPQQNGCQPKNPLAPQSLAGTSVWGDPHITSPNGNQQQFAEPNALLENGNGSAVLVRSPGYNQEATSASAYRPGQDSSINTNPSQTEVYENLNGLLRELGTAQSLGITENASSTGQSIGTDPFQLGDNTSVTFNQGTVNFAQA